MHQEVRPFPAEDAWERLLPSCRNMCSKAASQGQRDKSLVLSVGRIHAQIYTEMFLYILTNIGRGEKKRDYWGQGWDLKMKHVIGGSSLLLEGLKPTGEERPVSKSRGDYDWVFHAKPTLAAFFAFHSLWTCSRKSQTLTLGDSKEQFCCWSPLTARLDTDFWNTKP